MQISLKEIDGYTIFHHGSKEQICSTGQNEIAILFSITFSKFYKLFGSLPPVIPQKNDIAMGGFVGIKLYLKGKVNKKGAFRRKKESLKLSITLFTKKIKWILILSYLQCLALLLKDVFASGQDMKANFECRCKKMNSVAYDLIEIITRTQNELK